MNFKVSIAWILSVLWLPAPLLADPSDLTWIEGRWCFSTEGTTIEEYWLSPVGGETVGLSRTSSDSEMSSFEYLRITRDESKVQYIAQPGGVAPTAFNMTSSGPGWMIFENQHHDFPQKITYHREGNSLTASISGPGEGGEQMRFEFAYQRCP